MNKACVFRDYIGLITGIKIYGLDTTLELPYFNLWGYGKRGIEYKAFEPSTQVEISIKARNAKEKSAELRVKNLGFRMAT